MRAAQPSIRARRGCRALLAAVAVSAGALLAPCAGQAAVSTFGSNLSKAANFTEQHGADVAFWQTAIDGNPSAGRAPADGQVTLVKIKGQGPPGGSADPRNQFHLQVLHPAAGTQVRVELSSQEYFFPANGTPSDVNSFQPLNFCVHKGDWVDFNDVGGGDRAGFPNGVPWTIFNRDAGSGTAWYSQNNGTNVGAQFAPAQTEQTELLLQSTLATGPNATDICPGGYAQHIFQGLSILDQAQTLVTATGAVKVKGFCPGPSYGGCHGTLDLTALINGVSTKLGSVPFDAAPNQTLNTEFDLTSANVKAIQKAKQVTAKATATAHDDPASDTRAANNKPPVQNATTSANVTITPDKLLPKKKHKKKKKKKKKPKDSDKDKIPDSWEKKYGLNKKNKKDAKKDKDKDGLTNLQEYKHKTNPKKKDTDDDGVSDGQEVKEGTDPLDKTSHHPFDADGDGVVDGSDNCPSVKNGGQSNIDGDSQGDACDGDDDNDGSPDGSDNCPTASNPGQANNDKDKQGDACDPDDDNDGVADGPDDCPTISDASQVNTDKNLPGGDAQGDACDADDDGDGAPDTNDNCPLTANADQTNTDKNLSGGDQDGDACDNDDDADGVSDADEMTHGTNPLNPDSDGDGVSDGTDACPSGASAGTDTDGDGCKDANEDSDDDNDGLSDSDEATATTDPLDPDTDGDTFSDGDEVHHNPPTDPKNAASHP